MREKLKSFNGAEIMTPEVFKEFKKAYEKAAKDNVEIFLFHGQPVLTQYAKYLIQYHDVFPKIKTK
jgi:hypothetical protein